jgi:PAT family beta-lactamase induction signal transducer AmpG
LNLAIQQSTLNVIFSRRMLVAFLMGFSGGLPLLLTWGVLQAWMTEKGVDLTWIGMISLVQIPYVWKFLWAPFLDRFIPPFLGRRRGWLIVSQIALMAAIVGLGYSDPVKNTGLMIGAALLVAPPRMWSSMPIGVKTCPMKSWAWAPRCTFMDTGWACCWPPGAA